MPLFKDWKEYSEKMTSEMIKFADLERSFINIDTQEENDRKKKLKKARTWKCLEESSLKWMRTRMHHFPNFARIPLTKVFILLIP